MNPVMVYMTAGSVEEARAIAVDGRTVTEAAKVALTSAAYAVEHHGTQEHFFTQDAFWARYRENFG